MASSAKEKKIARDYYKSHAKYRREKIEQRSEDYQEHKKKEASYSRNYYHSHPSYRKAKIAYAKAYRKAHKRKS